MTEGFGSGSGCDSGSTWCQGHWDPGACCGADCTSCQGHWASGLSCPETPTLCCHDHEVLDRSCQDHVPVGQVQRVFCFRLKDGHHLSLIPSSRRRLQIILLCFIHLFWLLCTCLECLLTRWEFRSTVALSSTGLVLPSTIRMSSTGSCGTSVTGTGVVSWNEVNSENKDDKKSYIFQGESLKNKPFSY